MTLFTAVQKSTIEEMEGVLARRMADGRLSAGCATVVTHALDVRMATKFQALLESDAEQQLGDEDGEDEAGEGWKSQPA